MNNKRPLASTLAATESAHPDGTRTVRGRTGVDASLEGGDQ